MKKKKLIYKILIILAISFAGCSVNEKYSVARDLYLKNNYVIAIQLYDDFLELRPDDALSIRSKLERSDAYYQLGYKAYKKENWILASRLFFLANSKIADKYLDECYFNLAKENFDNNNIEKALYYYDLITSYLTDSELTSQVLFNKINIHFDNDNKGLAFIEYHILWSNYPEHELTKQIQPTIDSFLPEYIDETRTLKKEGAYQRALSLLFNLNQYPSKLKSEIREEISQNYLLMADRDVKQKKYAQARAYCDSSLIYSPEKKSKVETKLENYCQKLLGEGNELVEAYKFDKAIAIFNKCFLIIPKYEIAKTKIEDTQNFKKNYNKSIELKEIAADYEEAKKFNKALQNYIQSNNHYSTSEVKHKIFLMNNIVESEKDPKTFAKKIILNYKNGKLSDRIMLLFEESKVLYGEDLVSSSGWKVSYAAGQYNYEVRYDIITSEQNYYFAWRVNNMTKQISPANKISEELMTEQVN